MPKQEGQKSKLLALLHIFEQQTDEEHLLNVPQLVELLARQGILCERKSVYSDIDALNALGYDIRLRRGRSGGYWMATRPFELAELKLLVDVVQASRFITQRKSRELIQKLEQFVSAKEATQLQRQVYVAGRVKTENESIYYNVDFIHRAIQENRQISFQYMEWTLDRRLVPRKGGERYVISPWALSWNDENYYLIGYDAAADQLKHYRVDKMGSIQLTALEREGGSAFKSFDIAAYTNKTFGMYGGKEETVSLEFADRLIGVVIDRFGKETDIRRLAEGTFRIRVKVAVS